MDEGKFVEWLKADGDAVRTGDVVFRLEGEKAVEEIESFDAGILYIPTNAPKPGESVKVAAVIGYLLQPGEVRPESVVESPREQSGLSHQTSDKARATSVDRAAASCSPAITPRARRLADKRGIDTGKLTGTGRNGRIRERDVAKGSPPASDRVIPLTAIRRAIAARMTESRQSIVPVTLTSAVDMTILVGIRQKFKAMDGDGLVPSYGDLLVKSAAVALQIHPLLAARWTDAGLVLPERIDIGIAVDTDAGLLVPVIRDVPGLGLKALAARSRELIDQARSGGLSMGDMRGGCFTVTNLGAFGIDAFTPIINPPECAILGVGRIERRPVMDGDRVIGRDFVTLSLTFDHRILDGGPAAQFMQSLAKSIENPGPWLSL